MRAAAAASGRAQGLESVEREAVHLAVEAHVRHVPVAAAVELLDPVRVHVRARAGARARARVRVGVGPPP